jgi:hypothetical protein
LISVDLAKKLAKYIPWEPKVGDLTIVFGEAGEEIIEPINLKHEKEKKLSSPFAAWATSSGSPA